MPEKLRVADVGLDSRLAGSDAIYTYRATSDTVVGQANMVPLGPRQTLGYVISVREVDEDSLGFPSRQLKPLGKCVEGLSLPPESIELLHDVARETLTKLSVCLSLLTPPGINDRLVTSYKLIEHAEAGSLTAAQDEALQVLREKPIQEGKGKHIPRGTKSALRALVKKGLVEQVVAVTPFSERSKPKGHLRLNPDRNLIDKFLKGPGKRKPAQAITLMRLQGSESASFSVDELKSIGQVSEATINALVQSNLLVETAEQVASSAQIPTPNSHQQTAIDTISAAIREHSDANMLLYGITGSGKTEVYLRAAEEALRFGRQVLYLVPEIALTAQVIAQLRARFGKRVAILHSNMTPGERMESWLRVRNGEAPVILGPRSAIFAPVNNLGLIIMDEEHEASYKQENAPRYHTKRIAQLLAKRYRCPLVLGSATPSIESFHEAKTGKLQLLTLPARAHSEAKLPEVNIVDLREAYKDRTAAVFSPDLASALTETLQKGDQAILFLNRRAFAPFVVCRECGHQFKCPHCAISLALHRKAGKLRCHHCDYNEPSPKTCPSCVSEKVGAFGIGAEKVEEAVQIGFPEARVARLDRDIARKKGALEEILAAFRSGETNVLVGTQMVAKGLDFPNVTLVGVIAADISLNIPDFRASERTFQLLTQVAGRAGRGQRPGRVFIQTLSADHPSVIASQSHDYESRSLKLLSTNEEKRLTLLSSVWLTFFSQGQTAKKCWNCLRWLASD